MLPVEAWKRHRKYKRRIRDLQAFIENAGAKQYAADPDEDADLFRRETSAERLELDVLEQAPFLRSAARWGVDIPDEYCLGESPFLIHLSQDGLNWLRREVSRRRREIVKDWVAIISPIASAVIAILGLLVALKKR